MCDIDAIFIENVNRYCSQIQWEAITGADAPLGEYLLNEDLFRYLIEANEYQPSIYERFFHDGKKPSEESVKKAFEMLFESFCSDLKRDFYINNP